MAATYQARDWKINWDPWLSNKNLFERDRRVMLKLLYDGPSSPYQIEKKEGIKHATLSEVLIGLQERGWIGVTESKEFRTGLQTRKFMLTHSGFFEGLLQPALIVLKFKTDETKSIPELYPKLEPYNRLDEIAQSRPDLFPWLFHQWKQMKAEGMEDLARAFLFIGIHSYPESSSSRGPPTIEERTVEGGVITSRFRGELVLFLLHVLYPELHIDSDIFAPFTVSGNPKSKHRFTIGNLDGNFLTGVSEGIPAYLSQIDPLGLNPLIPQAKKYLGSHEDLVSDAKELLRAVSVEFDLYQKNFKSVLAKFRLEFRRQ